MQVEKLCYNESWEELRPHDYCNKLSHVAAAYQSRIFQGLIMHTPSSHAHAPASRNVNIRTVRARPVNPLHEHRVPTKSILVLNVKAPSTSLSQTKAGNFSYLGEGYKYTLKNNGTKLLLQCKREVMDKFRTSRVGRMAMELVDCFEQGGAWYEVTSQDFTNYEERDGIPRNGLKIWLRLFNQFSSNPVIVKVLADPITGVETPPAYVDDAVLAERDAHVARFQVSIRMKAADKIVKIVPAQVKTVAGKINAVAPKASADKLAALAAAFKKR